MHLEIIKITYNRTAMYFMDDRFVNLGDKVILTLWQSGASESATVISLIVCYWLESVDMSKCILSRQYNLRHRSTVFPKCHDKNMVLFDKIPIWSR